MYLFGLFNERLTDVVMILMASNGVGVPVLVILMVCNGIWGGFSSSPLVFLMGNGPFIEGYLLKMVIFQGYVK